MKVRDIVRQTLQEQDITQRLTKLLGYTVGQSQLDAAIEAIGVTLTQKSAGKIGSYGLAGGSYAYYPANKLMTVWTASDGSRFKAKLSQIVTEYLDNGGIDVLEAALEVAVNPSADYLLDPFICRRRGQADHELATMRGSVGESSIRTLAGKIRQSYGGSGKRQEKSVYYTSHQDGRFSIEFGGSKYSLDRDELKMLKNALHGYTFVADTQ